MAIYHFNAKIIGRSQGKSAVAAAAYRAAEALHSEHQDVLFDYSKKHGVSYSEIITPVGAPDWTMERNTLWNAVELFEKRKDATYAREVEVSLPVELSTEQHKELLREFINDNFISLGMVADYSIHDVDGHNPHAHIMLTLRPILENSFGQKAREWNDKSLFVTWREQWAISTNKHLALSGIDKKITHLSFVDQGIDLEPTIHRGYMARENLEKLDRFQKMKAIKTRNYEHLLVNPEVALQLLTNHESIFNHHDLSRFVNERTDSADEFMNLKIAIETCDSIVSLGTGIDGKDYYTAKKVLQQEHDLIERATRLSKSQYHKLDPRKFDFVLASRTLNEEQLAAFEYILSGNNLSFVVGFAGTGKSYLMDAVREAYEAKGYSVLGTALSGRATDGLMQSANIESRTIARFLIDWENGRAQLTDKTVLIIDEIGMVGTRQMQALLVEAERAGAKIIGCGDPEQIPPVEAGCPFRFLLERIEHVFLKQVVRQKVDWQRQATIELSTRQHGKAIDRYQNHGVVYTHTTRTDAISAVVDNWQKYSANNPDKSALMMTYQNIDVLAMNLMARERLKEAGSLNESCSQIDTAAFGTLEFAVGDNMMFLRNERSINVKNGLRGRITHINDSILTIAMERGDIVSLDTHFYKDIGYGYASTIHKSQGETVDQSFVLATPQMDRFLANVSLDRHRDGVELHYSEDDFKSYDNLKRTLSRGESKVLAVEFAQARGIDYNIASDEAAEIESKTNFSSYYEKILSESVSIEGTPAERYLQKQGLTDINIATLQFHPSVWERESQTFMPALVAKAVGKDDNVLKTKGMQITFLDSATENKAILDYPVRYSGSSDAIIMLQKPSQQDNRWHLTPDIETGLAISKANPNIRIAVLATQERFDKNPLQGNGTKELIFCANQSTPKDIIDNVIYTFTEKQFLVRIAKPEQESTFNKELKIQGGSAVCSQLNKAEKGVVRNINIGMKSVRNHFEKLDQARKEADNQPYAAYRVHANEAIEKYALEISKNITLLNKIKADDPILGKRITTILDKDQGLEL